MKSKKNLIEVAQDWFPETDDEYGEDKKLFINYLITECCGRKNAKSINSVINALKNKLKKVYKKEIFQHKIIVPLRRDPTIFIGTSSTGIYFIKDADDAITTLDFYTRRIRSEVKHLRNLKILIKNKIDLDNYNYSQKVKRKNSVYFDESGVPSLNNMQNDPFFIVTGIIIESRKGKPILELDKKFAYIKDILHKPTNYEFKSGGLNYDEYSRVLKELSTIDYEFVSVCFIKEELYGEGFKNSSKSFYKYSFDFLIKNITNYIEGNISLFFDQYSQKNSAFQDEFFNYLKEKNLEFKFKRVDNIEMFDSKDHPYIQLADLIAGVLKLKMKKKVDLFNLIEEKCIDVIYFPYKDVDSFA